MNLLRRPSSLMSSSLTSLSSLMSSSSLLSSLSSLSSLLLMSRASETECEAKNRNNLLTHVEFNLTHQILVQWRQQHVGCTISIYFLSVPIAFSLLSLSSLFSLYISLSCALPLVLSLLRSLFCSPFLLILSSTLFLSLSFSSPFSPLSLFLRLSHTILIYLL